MALEKIDERLREAAIHGDVEFLRKCVADKKPNDYYLTHFPYRERGKYGNMFHIAAIKQQEEWIREAIEGGESSLPVEVVHQLICHSRPEEFNDNPLHAAAERGNVKIVKMFLKAFSSSSSLPSSHDRLLKLNPPPWLMKDVYGKTPCHVALYRKNQICGLEILKMDKVSLSNMIDDDGWSLLYHAVYWGLDKVAMEILQMPPHSFNASGPDGDNALHFVANCSSSERRNDILKLLLNKMSKLIKQKTSKEGLSVLHIWAKEGKIWPFKCLIESDDIIPDVWHDFVELISVKNNNGANPLHYLAMYTTSKEGAEIGKLLIDTYKREQVEAYSSSSNITVLGEELQYPWLIQDNENKTPLDYAMDKGNEGFAKLILMEDKYALKTCHQNVLFMAIEKRFHEVPLKILEIVDEEGFTHLLKNDQKLNALHLAPKCKRDFFEELLKRHPELIVEVDKEGETILHKWVEIGQVWHFEYLLNNPDLISYLRRLSPFEDNEGNNPIHAAASCINESIPQVVKLIAQFVQKEFPNLNDSPAFYLDHIPWICKNKEGEGAFHIAIQRQQDQKLALSLLSLLPKEEDFMVKWLDYYAPREHEILFLAVQKNFSDVVKAILSRLNNKASWTKYLQNSSNENVLHLASNDTDTQFCRWLIEELPSELIIQQDESSKMTPLDKAGYVGATWVVKLMLEKAEKHPSTSAFKKAPLAWIKACEEGHPSVIETFVDCCPIKFGDHCKQHHDTPLHHIKLRNLTRYEDFLKIRYMKDLVNVQDSNGATPLHKAIENGNIFLAEVLLNMDNIRYNIKDHEGKSARGMLSQLCKEPESQWDVMCNSIGFDPKLQTSYFQRRTDLLEVRNTLSVVAALLATITFTAGFTLPGGLNQDTGEAMIVNKAAFVVFIISDTFAMCFSMVVLICLIWSMVFEPNESLYLIDRSVGLLRLALYLTLLAFVTGVYIVISQKLLWAAIFIIVLCSLVLGVSLKRKSLYNVFKLIDNLCSSVSEKCPDQMHCMELGRPLLTQGGRSTNQTRT